MYMCVYLCVTVQKQRHWLKTIVGTTKHRNQSEPGTHWSIDFHAGTSMWWNDEWKKNSVQREHQDSNGNLYNGMTSVCWKLLIKTEVANMYSRVWVCVREKEREWEKIRSQLHTKSEGVRVMVLMGWRYSTLPTFHGTMERARVWCLLDEIIETVEMRFTCTYSPPIERISNGLVSQSEHFQSI